METVERGAVIARNVQLAGVNFENIVDDTCKQSVSSGGLLPAILERYVISVRDSKRLKYESILLL